MSVHLVYMKDGAKMMRPVNSRAEYLALRNGVDQVARVKLIRKGREQLKTKLLQFNYSCLPNEDGSLKGTTKISNTVGMDIDFKAPENLTPEEQKAWLEERMQGIPALVLAKKDELGLVFMERSAVKGYHLAFRRRPELTQEENLKWASQLLGVDFDENAKDITRVFYTTTGSDEDLLFLSDDIFLQEAAPIQQVQKELKREEPTANAQDHSDNKSYPQDYHGIPFTDILNKYWEVNNRGFEPTTGDRDTLTYQLACDLRHICGKNYEWLDQVIPCYDGFTPEEKRQKIQSALNSELEAFPMRLRKVLDALERKSNTADNKGKIEETEDDESLSKVNSLLSNKKMPLGVSDSIEAVGPGLAMPVLTAICPCIGALATGVELDVHGQKKGLNLISYIAGDFASGKGSIDPVVEAWMSEMAALDKMYLMQEDEWRNKKRAAKNKKEQPEEPKLPIRYLTLNNTVANLAERLANTEGKHAFSFTPEADTVAQKWKSAMSDFSVMLRQSYDGTRYDREARSVDAVNVHIERLLWNVTMCGTPDALYRVVSNYTDGFQSRIAVARTPDNTFSPLTDKPYVLTSRQTEHIKQVAHLLPLMQGDIVLQKLEAKGREWVERVRVETMMNDDKVMARQRFRICVTSQRMTCCLMLCKVCEMLIQKHGLNGAEVRLKQYPYLWKEMLLKAQTPQMLEVYEMIADSLLENALHFFRERIENAFVSRDYAGQNGERLKRGKNDTIFERLDVQFTFEQATQHSIAIKGANVTRNSVQQMLKNWRNQGLIIKVEEGQYRKM